MKIAISFCSVCCLVFSTLCLAQTCSAPYPIPSGTAASATTCEGTQQLPTLANGAMSGRQQIVYHVTVAPSSTALPITVTPDPGTDVALFVCSNRCSPSATCVAAIDDNGQGGAETATLPSGAGEYFVIVQNVGVCGNFSLTAPLSD